MRIVIVILLIISSFNISVSAKNRETESYPRFTYGVEWGYVATLASGYRYVFFPPEGYRVDTSGEDIGLHNNAEMYVHGGYNINGRWNLSLYAGYLGISDFHKAVPVSLRLSMFSGTDPMRDRWFGFIDLGSGISIKRVAREILTGKIGGGYRISLSRDTKLDFVMAARITGTHPTVVYDGAIISKDMVRRNNAYACALSAGISVTF